MKDVPDFDAAVSALWQGDFAAAERICRELLGRTPGDHQLHHVLGLALMQQRKFPEAERALFSALGISPDNPLLYHDMGSLMLRTKRPADAANAFRRAIELRQGFPQAFAGLASALGDSGLIDQAIDAANQALRMDPKDGLTWNRLGGWLRDRNRFLEAEQAFRQAMSLTPANPAPANNLGNLLRQRRRYDEARSAFETAIRLDPENPAIQLNFAMALAESGDISTALTYALALDPWHSAVSWSLNGLQYNETDPERIAFWHREFGRHAQCYPRPARRSSNAGRIRLGYVSADLHNHPVGWFMRPVIRNHDRKRFEVFCYDSQPASLADALTDELKQQCDGWRTIFGSTAEAAAEQIRADGIDILIDLGGHTEFNRLDVMARHPAPLQLSYLGYPGTTGLAAIDYLITDSIVAPRDSGDRHYAEALIRLDRPFFIFQPPNVDLPIAPLPARENGYVTFGAFHNLKKLTPDAIFRWAAILKALPGSKLLINAPTLDDELVSGPVHEQFSLHGITRERLELIGFIPMVDHCRLYDRVDIVLDSFPWNGHTSTINALWHGVPVIVQTGSHHAARMGAAILSPLGLSDWTAGSAGEYIETAVRKAGDLDSLARTRSELRNRILESPFSDHAGFVREFEGRIERAFASCRE